MKFIINLLFAMLSVCSCIPIQGQKLSTPKTTYLVNCPKPQTILIPLQGEHSRTFVKQAANGTFIINLKPPLVFPLPVVSKIISPASTIKTEVGEVLDQSDAGIGFFTNYTTDNGLTLDAVFCSLIDQFGNLWFGTAGGGVSRYDGKSFTNFTKSQGLASNAVFSIAEDKNGNIWFGTYGNGVSCYDGKSFTNYSKAQGLADNYVYCIFKDTKGNIWFGTDGGGVSCYDGKTFVNYSTAQGLADKNVRSIAEDKNGSLWFGTHNGGVSRYDGNIVNNTSANNKSNQSPSKLFVNYSVAQGLTYKSIFSIVEDDNGNLWFGTFGGGIFCYDGKSFTHYSMAQGLISDYVRTMLKDNKGNLWVGTRDGGVSCFNLNGVINPAGTTKTKPFPSKMFTNYSITQGLANNNVRSILQDKQGDLWFSTGGGGISRYDGKSFINYTITQGLANNYLRSIAEDKNGNLWFGAWNGGVSCYNRKSFTTYSVNQGLANEYVNSILKDQKGNLWLATNGGGISCYDGKSFTNFTTLQGLSSNYLRTIFEDKKGNIWVGTENSGISCFDGKSFTNYFTEQGLTKNTITSIAEDKYGYIWFGTDGGGLFYLNGNRKDNSNQIPEKYFTNFNTSNGLASNVVYCITVDKTKNIWIGTAGGGISRLLAKDLDKFYDKKNSRYNDSEIVFKNLSSKSGLSSDVIDGIIEDKKGNIVIGTNLGFTVLTPTEINKGGKIITIGEDIAWAFKIYNSKTGYPVKDINGGCNNHGALFCDSKGIIWAGTGSDKTALVRFDPTEIYKNTEPPTLVIQSIKINNENISWYNLSSDNQQKDSLAQLNEEILIFGKPLSNKERNDMYSRYGNIESDSITRFYPIPENLVLPSKNNNITFEYAAIEPARPFMIKYQYILEGYDKEWNPITNKTSASFGNISGGTYTFKIKACSPENVWSEPITYTFKVLPPWYLNWWMYPIYFALFVIMIWSFIKRREIKLNKEKENLEQQVEIRTAQLLQANEEIKQNIAIVEKTAQIKQQFLANMSHEIRTPMNVIMGMLNMVNETKLNETQIDYIQTIQTASENLLNIINDILDLNKIEAGKMELKLNTFDVFKTANKIKKLFEETAKSKGIDFNVIVSKDIIQYIKADENRIIQIVSNLISNAFKFTHKGNISVNFSIANQNKEKVVFFIEVIDTGIGIKEDDQKRLFTKFSQLDNTLTRSYEGTGLGLAISKEFAELMGGEIGVKSEYKKGSTFWFTFAATVSDKNDCTSDKTVTQSFKDLHFNVSVLLVEDKFVNQKVETLILENIGCKVTIANNGKEAVDLISEGNKYDIVFMDIQMPIMDGIEAVSILRKNYKPLPPIIGLSANALEGDAERYISLGMDDYLSKPFTTEQIKEKLFKWIHYHL